MVRLLFQRDIRYIGLRVRDLYDYSNQEATPDVTGTIGSYSAFAYPATAALPPCLPRPFPGYTGLVARVGLAQNGGSEDLRIQDLSLIFCQIDPQILKS
jgi:hypothetical protein